MLVVCFFHATVSSSALVESHGSVLDTRHLTKHAQPTDIDGTEIDRSPPQDFRNSWRVLLSLTGLRMSRRSRRVSQLKAWSIVAWPITTMLKVKSQLTSSIRVLSSDTHE